MCRARTATACSASTSSTPTGSSGEIRPGCEGIKPGWVRVNFNYFISEPVFEYVVEAVHLVAATAGGCCPTTGSTSDTGLWRHRHGPVEPPLRLSDLATTTTGALSYPASHARAPESALAGYLDEARDLLSRSPLSDAVDVLDGGGAARRPRRPGDRRFEALRWFELPPACLDNS